MQGIDWGESIRLWVHWEEMGVCLRRRRFCGANGVFMREVGDLFSFRWAIEDSRWGGSPSRVAVGWLHGGTGSYAGPQSKNTGFHRTLLASGGASACGSVWYMVW